MLPAGESLKNILVTGAAGFIGFHLAKRLKERGDRVVGLDNFNSYYDPIWKRKRAHLLKTATGIEVIEGDLLDKPRLQELVLAHKTTHLVHLAAQAGVRYSLQAPESYVKNNIEGFLNVLETCRCCSGVELIYASSSSVYGLNEKQPFSEEDRVDAQASFYGVTKKTNELMAGTYHHLFGMRATGLRFFTVYGPWGRPDMAHCLFARAILDGRPIQVYHEGKLQRDFTYIDDIIEGTVAAIDRGVGNQIFNLGNDHPESVLHLISLLEEALGKKAELQFLPLQPGDPLSTHANVEKSRRLLGYQPTISLREGVGRFCDWYIRNSPYAKI